MVRPSISMPEDLLDEIDDARDATTSRSEWVRAAIRDRLEADPDD